MSIRDKIIETVDRAWSEQPFNVEHAADALLALEIEGKGKCYGGYGCRRDVMQGIHNICPYSNCSDCDRYSPATIADLIR